MKDGSTYFATFDVNSTDYLEALKEKINIYRRYCEETGRVRRWQLALKNYFGISSDGAKRSDSVTRGGDQGERLFAKVSDYRNLIQHQLILITSQRPAGQAKAINSDTESLHQARIGTSLVEYYLSQVGYEQKFVMAAERALVANEAFAVLDWDPNEGENVRPDPETGAMLMSGDLRLRVVSPWNFIRDPYLDDPENMQWAIYHWRENKFDLAIKYPNMASAIIDSSDRGIKELSINNLSDKDTDQINVYCLIHNKTKACPTGRITYFIADEILFDGEFPYSEFNAYRMSQNEVFDSCFGYTNNNDLLGLEEVTDALHSVAISNNTIFGGQAIKGAKGLDFDYTKLGKGSVYFELDPGLFDKLEPLQLTKTSTETYNYIEMLSRKKETLAGINSVVRGDPEGALRSNSGSALALVQAQSLQFNSGGQRSYYNLLSKVCTGKIKLFQKYADTERIIRITGRVQGEFLNEFKFTKDDLTSISSVVFEMTDPISKTIGGRQAMADSLLNKQMIKNPRQYITLIKTGSDDAFTEDDEADELAIKAENELLREGQPVRVIITENHAEHIQGHMSVIASPQSKNDPMLVQATLQHINEHTQVWQQLSMTNPAILIATKQNILPMMPGMGGPPGPAGPQGPEAGGPPQNPGNMQAMLSANPPVQQEAENVRGPQMPKNPLTGERAPNPVPPQVA